MTVTPMAHEDVALKSPRPLPRLRFGLFELDRSAGTLLRNGHPVRLPPQPLAMLIELVEHAGEQVTREHLQKVIWPADTFVDFDASIGSCVRKIRLALGDTSENPVFIRTVHRKGFQFIAPVHAVMPEAPELPAAGKLSLARAQAAGAVVGESAAEAEEFGEARDAPAIKEVPINRTVPGTPAQVGGTEFAQPAAAPSGVLPSRWNSYWRWLRWAVPFALLIPVAWWLGPWVLPGGSFGAHTTMTVLTSFPGGQYYPALSPDGNQVAFSWKEEAKTGGQPAAYSIYVAATKYGGTPRRITNAAANDLLPVWSPEGSRIAFIRGTSDLMLIGSLGGNERKVANALPYSVSWSPDGKEIAYAAWDSTGRHFAIFATEVETGAKRQITYPPAGGSGDSHADFSPDGRRIAFFRCFASDCDIHLTSSSGGTVTRVTSDHNSSFHGLTWSPDGRSIVYSSQRTGQYRLWQVAVLGKGAPREVVSGGEDASYPRFAPGIRRDWRLVYEKHIRNSNVWQLKADPAGRNGKRPVTDPARRLIASTRIESSPQISPDGNRVAFVSDRTGYDELWTADADGQNDTELTLLKSLGVGSPKWSPSGTQIVFDMLSRSGRAVFVIDSRGGSSSQRTAWGDASRPSWSRDGRWIYYSSGDAAGVKQIWKISSGPERRRQQVTSDGGFGATESPDGQTLFYTRGRELRSMPAGGGASSLVSKRAIADGWWGLAADGLYFADLYGGDSGAVVRSGPKAIYFLNLQSGAATKIADIVGEVNRPTPDFCVSADGRTILYSILEIATSQVQMIEEAH